MQNSKCFTMKKILLTGEFCGREKIPKLPISQDYLPEEKV